MCTLLGTDNIRSLAHYFAAPGEEAVAHGRVHDDNTLIMDGAAGHAGLFDDAEAVYEVARAWLEAGLYGLDASTRDMFWTAPEGSGRPEPRRIGFDGERLRSAVGGPHECYVGTALTFRDN